MTILPASETLVPGQSAMFVVNTELVDPSFVVVSSATTVATASMSDGLLTVLAVATGTAIITVTATSGEDSETAMCTVTVQAAPVMTSITNDGSGTGNDTNVFGRQYVINQNLLAVNSTIGLLKSTVNTIKILSAVTTGLSVANLATIAANLVVAINMLGDIQTLIPQQAGATAKNTVTI